MAFGFKGRSPVQGREVGKRKTAQGLLDALAEAKYRDDQKAFSDLKYIERNGLWVSIDDREFISKEAEKTRQNLRKLGYDV